VKRGAKNEYLCLHWDAPKLITHPLPSTINYSQNQQSIRCHPPLTIAKTNNPSAATAHFPIPNVILVIEALRNSTKHGNKSK
ncbi:hypothetical protein, partial [Limnofasciculus baicalensis]